MKNSFKIELLKNILNFNFFFLESNSKQDSRAYKNILNFKTIKNSKSFLILDPIQLVKNIKQTVRLLQYLKLQQKSTLQINFEDKYFSELMNYLIIEKQIFEKKIELTTNINLIDKSENSILFSINQNSSGKEYKKYFSKNIFLINNINSINEINNFGNYKINNDINDWKKFVFIILLIKKIYNKTNYEKNF